MIGTGGMRCRGTGHGIEADFGPEHADTFRRDLHPDLRADYVLANPPFNPARCGTNFAWGQHFIHHLAPHGMVGFVLANGSMSSNQSGEVQIRRAIIQADLETEWSSFLERAERRRCLDRP